MLKTTTFRQLRTLQTVARVGSISGAANELHLTQPAVSLQISLLGEAAGTPLLRRVGREVQFTAAGEVMARYANEILSLWNEAGEEVAALRGELGGTLRIGAITTAHGHRAPGMRRLGLFAGLVGVSMLLVSVAPTLPWAMLAMVPVGFAAMCFMITGNTMLQTNAKPEARGRVMALYGIVFLGSTPFGAPLAGWLGQELGPRLEFALMGMLAIGVGAVVLTLRRRSQEATTIEDPVTGRGPAIAAR